MAIATGMQMHAAPRFIGGYSEHGMQERCRSGFWAEQWLQPAATRPLAATLAVQNWSPLLGVQPESDLVENVGVTTPDAAILEDRSRNGHTGLASSFDSSGNRRLNKLLPAPTPIKGNMRSHPLREPGPLQQPQTKTRHKNTSPVVRISEPIKGHQSKSSLTSSATELRGEALAAKQQARDEAFTNIRSNIPQPPIIGFTDLSQPLVDVRLYQPPMKIEVQSSTHATLFAKPGELRCNHALREAARGEESIPRMTPFEECYIEAVHEYVQKHSLEGRLVDVVESVLQEQPENPTEYLASMLLQYSTSNASNGSFNFPSLLEDSTQHTQLSHEVIRPASQGEPPQAPSESSGPDVQQGNQVRAPWERVPSERLGQDLRLQQVSDTHRNFQSEHDAAGSSTNRVTGPSQDPSKMCLSSDAQVNRRRSKRGGRRASASRRSSSEVPVAPWSPAKASQMNARPRAKSQARRRRKSVERGHDPEDRSSLSSRASMESPWLPTEDPSHVSNSVAASEHSRNQQGLHPCPRRTTSPESPQIVTQFMHSFNARQSPPEPPWTPAERISQSSSASQEPPEPPWTPPEIKSLPSHPSHQLHGADQASQVSKVSRVVRRRRRSMAQRHSAPGSHMDPPMAPEEEVEATSQSSMASIDLRPIDLERRRWDLPEYCTTNGFRSDSAVEPQWVPQESSIESTLSDSRESDYPTPYSITEARQASMHPRAGLPEPPKGVAKNSNDEARRIRDPGEIFNHITPASRKIRHDTSNSTALEPNWAPEESSNDDSPKKYKYVECRDNLTTSPPEPLRAPGESSSDSPPRDTSQILGGSGLHTHQQKNHQRKICRRRRSKAGFTPDRSSPKAGDYSQGALSQQSLKTTFSSGEDELDHDVVDISRRHHQARLATPEWGQCSTGTDSTRTTTHHQNSHGDHKPETATPSSQALEPEVLWSEHSSRHGHSHENAHVEQPVSTVASSSSRLAASNHHHSTNAALASISDNQHPGSQDAAYGVRDPHQFAATSLHEHERHAFNAEHHSILVDARRASTPPKQHHNHDEKQNPHGIGTHGDALAQHGHERHAFQEEHHGVQNKVRRRATIAAKAHHNNHAATRDAHGLSEHGNAASQHGFKAKSFEAENHGIQSKARRRATIAVKAHHNNHAGAREPHGLGEHGSGASQHVHENKSFEATDHGISNDARRRASTITKQHHNSHDVPNDERGIGEHGVAIPHHVHEENSVQAENHGIPHDARARASIAARQHHNNHAVKDPHGLGEHSHAESQRGHGVGPFRAETACQQHNGSPHDVRYVHEFGAQNGQSYHDHSKQATSSSATHEQRQQQNHVSHGRQSLHGSGIRSQHRQNGKASRASISHGRRPESEHHIDSAGVNVAHKQRHTHHSIPQADSVKAHQSHHQSPGKRQSHAQNQLQHQAGSRTHGSHGGESGSDDNSIEVEDSHHNGRETVALAGAHGFDSRPTRPRDRNAPHEVKKRLAKLREVHQQVTSQTSPPGNDSPGPKKRKSIASAKSKARASRMSMFRARRSQINKNSPVHVLGDDDGVHRNLHESPLAQEKHAPCMGHHEKRSSLPTGADSEDSSGEQLGNAGDFDTMIKRPSRSYWSSDHHRDHSSISSPPEEAARDVPPLTIPVPGATENEKAEELALDEVTPFSAATPTHSDDGTLAYTPTPALTVTQELTPTHAHTAAESNLMGNPEAPLAQTETPFTAPTRQEIINRTRSSLSTPKSNSTKEDGPNHDSSLASINQFAARLQTREERLACMFQLLDKNRTGFLRSEELYVLAETLEFDWDEEACVAEFNEICDWLQVDPEEGIAEDMFQTLMDDAEGDFFIETEELPYVLEDIRHRRGNTPPSILVHKCTTLGGDSIEEADQENDDEEQDDAEEEEDGEEDERYHWPQSAQSLEEAMQDDDVDSQASKQDASDWEDDSHERDQREESDSQQEEGEEGTEPEDDWEDEDD